MSEQLELIGAPPASALDLDAIAASAEAWIKQQVGFSADITFGAWINCWYELCEGLEQHLQPVSYRMTTLNTELAALPKRDPRKAVINRELKELDGFIGETARARDSWWLAANEYVNRTLNLNTAQLEELSEMDERTGEWAYNFTLNQIACILRDNHWPIGIRLNRPELYPCYDRIRMYSEAGRRLAKAEPAAVVPSLD